MASCGENKNLDLVIKDIYGEGARPHNLDEDIIASRFNKTYITYYNTNNFK